MYYSYFDSHAALFLPFSVHEVHTYSKSGASSRIACGSIVTLDLRNPLALRPNKIHSYSPDVKLNGTNIQHLHFTGIYSDLSLLESRHRRLHRHSRPSQCHHTQTTALSPPSGPAVWAPGAGTVIYHGQQSNIFI